MISACCTIRHSFVIDKWKKTLFQERAFTHLFTHSSTCSHYQSYQGLFALQIPSQNSILFAFVEFFDEQFLFYITNNINVEKTTTMKEEREREGERKVQTEISAFLFPY